MLVRPMDPADRARVVEIAGLGDQELDVDAELARSWARIWTAGDPVVAFLLAWAVADELHVINVATHPDHRRCGAARALLADAGLTQASRPAATAGTISTASATAGNSRSR